MNWGRHFRREAPRAGGSCSVCEEAAGKGAVNVLVSMARQGRRGSSGGGWKRLCGGSTEGTLKNGVGAGGFDGSRFPGRIRGERRL